MHADPEILTTTECASNGFIASRTQIHTIITATHHTFRSKRGCGVMDFLSTGGSKQPVCDRTSERIFISYPPEWIDLRRRIAMLLNASHHFMPCPASVSF